MAGSGSVQVRRRREAAAFLSSFVGAQAELLVDTTNNRVQVHDGSTPGGWPAARLIEPNHTVDDGVNCRFKTILTSSGSTQFYVGKANAADSALTLALTVLASGQLLYPATPAFSGPLAGAYVADWKSALESYIAGSVQTMFENYVGAQENDPGRIAFYHALARVGGTFEGMVLKLLRLSTANGGAGLSSSTTPTDVAQLATLRASAQTQLG